jgi:inward rectifier potassium channel
MTAASPSAQASAPPAGDPCGAGGHGDPRVRATGGTDPSRIVRLGQRPGRRDDLYHFLLVASWGHVIALVAGVYLGVNLFFACVYTASGDCIANASSFADRFFFSVQTFSTIGYGVMAPKTGFASVVVTVEAFFGLILVAMATGLMFAKFSRPTSRVLFSDKMVIAKRNGKPTLMLRMANERGNDVIEAAFRVTVLKAEVSEEGESMRRLYDLALVRSDTPLFTVSFTAFHVIDEASPILGETAASLREGQVRFIVTVTGLDSTFATTIHARHVYDADAVVFGARFVDVVSTLPDGRMQLDFTKFHDVVAVADEGLRDR